MLCPEPDSNLVGWFQPGVCGVSSSSMEAYSTAQAPTTCSGLGLLLHAHTAAVALGQGMHWQ